MNKGSFADNYLSCHKYIRSIRNPNKRNYASYYFAFLMGHVTEEILNLHKSDISGMARQAVEMRLNKLFD